MKIWRIGFAVGAEALNCDVAADSIPEALEESVEAVQNIWKKAIEQNKELKEKIKAPTIDNINSVVLVTETAN